MLKILLLLNGWLMVAVAEAQFLGREGRKVWVSWPTSPDQASLLSRADSTAAVRLGWGGGVEGHVRGRSPQLKGETKVIIILPFKSCVELLTSKYAFIVVHHCIHLLCSPFLENLLFSWTFTIARYLGDIHETDSFHLSCRWNLGCSESM